MRVKNIVMMVAVATLCFSVGVWAGNPITPAGAPSEENGQMYTLEQIYNLLTTGTTTDKMTEFTEPPGGPGTGTQKTLDEIMTAAQNNRCHCECIGCKLHGTRWCDNGDGTVTDLTTCLVWLQKADWGGHKPWRINSGCSSPDYTCYDDAHTRAGLLYAGATGANLSDGSEVGDWRLPTLTELKGLVNGSPALRCVDSPCDLYGFTGIQPNAYWSSTTFADNTSVGAWLVAPVDGDNMGYTAKYGDFFDVWPVRGGQ